MSPASRTAARPSISNRCGAVLFTGRLFEIDADVTPGIAAIRSRSASKNAARSSALARVPPGIAAQPISTLFGSLTPTSASTMFQKLRARTPAPPSSTIASVI